MIFLHLIDFPYYLLRYWKLSLMVHPDKCPHPQAHQAFIILNKAFKDLQDPDKVSVLTGGWVVGWMSLCVIF